MAIPRGAILLWILRHSGEIAGLIPLLKDAATYGGIQETNRDLIAILTYLDPILGDFPADTSVAAASAEEEASALGLFGGDGSRLNKVIQLLSLLVEIWKAMR